MRNLTTLLLFTTLCSLLFSLSGNAQCAPEIPGYINIGLKDGHNYYLSTFNAQPAEAQANAEALGGYLVVINSSEENELIEEYIDELTYLGFNDANTEGTIETFNGEPVTYTNIDPCGFCQSNNADNDYIVMEPWGNDGKWSFSNLWNARKYIVEIPCGTSNNSSECSFVSRFLHIDGFPLLLLVSKVISFGVIHLILKCLKPQTIITLYLIPINIISTRGIHKER